jgi:hypothetical protein
MSAETVSAPLLPQSDRVRASRAPPDDVPCRRVHLFIVGDFFRRRRRYRRASDPLPTAPLLRVLIFWVLFGLGALLGGIAMATVAGVAMMHAPLDRVLLSLMVAFAAGSIACLCGAIAIWMRMNRD